MRGITFQQKGDFSRTLKFLEGCRKLTFSRLDLLERYGREGVAALERATPKLTGKTASSWDYNIVRDTDRITITWTNSNIVDHVNIALLIQYGHATRNGAWIEGRDYINPAIQPIFDKLANNAWKELTKE